MNAYLNTFDHIIWVVFAVLEAILFFKLTADHLKPVKWFMAFALFRDVVLVNFLSRENLHNYFMLYWSFQMIELNWFAYVSGQIYRRLIGIQSRFPVILTISSVSLLSITNFPIKYTLPLLTMQTHSLIICMLVIGLGIWFKYKQTSFYWAIIGLMGSVLMATFAWQFLAYQTLMWEISWAVALLGIFESVRERPLPASAKPLTESA